MYTTTKQKYRLRKLLAFAKICDLHRYAFHTFKQYIIDNPRSRFFFIKPKSVKVVLYESRTH